MSHRNREGSTLIEVMMAVVLLALLVIAGGAYLFQARAVVAIQRNKRIAIETATRRMERLRGTPYEQLKPPVETYDGYYLARSGSTWRHHVTDPGERVSIGGAEYPIETRVRYVDADGGAPSYDHLWLQVAVGFRRGSDQRVTLETLYAP